MEANLTQILRLTSRKLQDLQRKTVQGITFNDNGRHLFITKKSATITTNNISKMKVNANF